MFSVRQKREIADKVQRILRETQHPELPQGEIPFLLHVDGAESWSWADIRNNGAVEKPGINPWNEAQGKVIMTDLPETSAPAPDELDIRKWLSTQKFAGDYYYEDCARAGWNAGVAHWKAEAERLTAELKETNKRLALAEKLLNDWTEAELRRTGGPQK